MGHAMSVVGSVLVALLFVCSLSSPAAAQAAWYPSRYGPNDELGALNEITPQKILEAVRLVKDGKVYDLGQVYEDAAPAYPPRYWKSWILFHGVEGVSGGGQLGDNKVTYLEEVINASLGVSTQLDGLGHVGIDHMFYNGNRLEDFATPTGLKKFGMERVPPIVTRGVLIDMVAYTGKPMDEGEVITPEDLQGALARQGNMELRPGDVVLLNTGWMRLWGQDNARFLKGEPGIGIAAARWLAQKRPAAVGADTFGVEVLPFEDPKRVFEAHQILLTQNGIYLMENIVLAELARDRVYEFLFVFGAPRTRGTPQGIGRPIAMR